MANPDDLLDTALKNKATLLSWKAIYTRLTTSPTKEYPTLTEYLLSPPQLRALSQPHLPFPPSSPGSKQTFETKTAAINFDSTDQAGPLPPIKDLKDEALALSESLKIDELGALRIVVLEYQSRDTVALLKAPLTSTEDDSGGLFSFEAAGNTGSNETEAEKKEKALNRRIAIYFQERRYITKAAEFLVGASFTKGSAWRGVGRRLVSEIKVGDKDILEEIIKTLRRKLAQEDGDIPQWIAKRVEEDADSDILYEWEKQSLLECIHLLQLLFILFYRPIESTGTIVTAWYKFMDDTAFLGRIKRFASQAAVDIQNLVSYLQPLASIISLTILSFDNIDDYLIAAFTRDNPPPTGGVTFSDNLFYMKSSNAMKLITQIFIENARNPVASLASFCWSLVLRRIGELLYSMGLDLDDFDSPPIEPSAAPQTPAKRKRTGHPAADLYISTLNEIYNNSVHGRSIIAYLAKSAVSDCRVFEVVIQLVTNVAVEGNGGIAWSMGHEENGKRMINVLASLVRRSTEVVEFSQGIVGAFLVLHEVPVSELWEILHSPSFMARDEEELEDSRAVIPADYASRSINDVVEKFWTDPEALPKILLPAKARFPYEPLPFLKIIHALATDASRTHTVLTSMNTYTQVLPVGFQAYEVCYNPNQPNGSSLVANSGNGSVTSSVDETDPGTIALADDLCLFAPRAASGYESSDEEVGGGGIIIPAGTIGKVISDNRTIPPVVMWDFQYSALTLFGRILECALVGSAGGGSNALVSRRGTVTVTDQMGNKEAVGEIISILTTMILASSIAKPGSDRKSANDQCLERVTAILEEASDAVAKNRDVVSIIFDLLEEELQASSRGGSSNDSTDFITIGIQFVDALTFVLPNRVWPYLARSSLLERYGREGNLQAITSGIEMVKGEYTFTCTSLKLYDDLVEDGIQGAVAKSSQNAPQRGGLGTGVSGGVQAGILEGWTHWGVDLFESYRGWKYQNGAERMEIGTRISTILTKILDTVYGVDDTHDLNSKITGILASSAEHLVKVFLSDSPSSIPLQPIIGGLQDGAATPESSLYTKPLSGWVEHVNAIMRFAATLVRVRAYLGLPQSQLEHQLFDSSPTIAKVYATHDGFKLSSIDLLEAMITAASSSPSRSTDLSSTKNSAEPPSLLGHLGTECASTFTQVLSTLDSPIHEPQLEIRIWNLISAIVSNKQQGMSILILRGETLLGGLEGKLKAKQSPANIVRKGNSILSAALNELSNLEKVDEQPERALAMLEAVALSQNFWSLAMDDMGRHPTFLLAMVKYVQSFNVEIKSTDKKSEVTAKAYKIAVIAYIAQIFALHLHTKRASSSRHEAGFINQLLDGKTLAYYFQHGVKIEGYRPSLHGNLAKNFEGKWPGFGIMMLKQTKLRKRVYGTNYFYDLELAGKVLGFDRFWESPSINGKANSTPAKANGNISANGYKNEVEESNLNLSLIDSQVALLRAWKLLAMELCPLAFQNAELSRSLIKVVENCLVENVDMWQLPTVLTNLILRDRAEFAFVILRKLSQQPARPGDGELYDGVFDHAWKTIVSQRPDFRRALSTGDNIAYYRSLLRIVYMALLGQRNRTSAVPVETAYKILDMLNLVVAQGFVDLAQAAQTNPEISNPEDIALITGILQISLRLPGIEVIHSGISTHIFDHGSIRAATTLYSWAEGIGAADNGSNDPVYGELAVLFLLELSYVPLLAEQLAVELLLDLLLTASLCKRIRDTMTAGLNNPLQHPRLHNIWSRGLLPILVNLLTAIGPRIGPNVVRFLSFFGNQVEGLVDSWGQRGNPITLPAVRETGTLVGLLEILRVWGVEIPAPKFLRRQPSSFGGDLMDISIAAGPIRVATDPFGVIDDDYVDGIRFDKGTILEGVEYLLNHRNYLASLVVPTTEEEERDNATTASKDGGDTGTGVTKLVEDVVKEMDTLRKLLTVVVGEEEGEEEGEKP